MLPRKASAGFTKLHQCSWNVLRRFSDQSLVTEKKTGTSVRVGRKPSRAPFMKNIFLGVFDTEMLVYPELDKPGLAELKKKVEPYKQYFKNSIDPKVISSLRMIPSEIIENLKNLGLFGQTVPTMYGGCEQSATETAFISEIIAKDLNVALTLYSHNFLGVQTLIMYGSHDQKEKYLPRLASGELIAAFCMSENVSSSDLSSISSAAVPADDNSGLYLLSGKKQWVINGTNANLFIVVAKFDHKTHTGLTLPVVRVMLVDRDSPGVTVTPPREHLGLNASNVCEVHFKDTPIHPNCFIGSETEGFEICSKILNSGRYNIGAITVSFLKNLLREASEFIISRKQFKKQLIECENIQHKFADVASCIFTLESMTYHTTAILDNYESPDCSLEMAIIKVYSFTEGRRCLDLILELMGGRAFLDSEIVQKYFRDFRTMEVFDGTTAVTNLFISLSGLQYAGVSMNESVNKMRFPFEYPSFILKRLFASRHQANDDPKLTLNLYEQLHPSLINSANELEYCVLRFDYAVATLFKLYGPDAINQQIDLMRLADAAVKIYAMTAVLARSSRSFCIGLRNAETELKYAIQICSAYKKIVRAELNDLIDGLVISGDVYAIKFGADIFKHKGYFLEHPLERSY